MITYELAKKLKECGYEFKITLIPGDIPPDELESMAEDGFISELTPYIVFKGEPRVYNIPNLSQLIEACLPKCEKFVLENTEFVAEHTWFASDDHIPGDPRKLGLLGYGKNPEEAVANLYLALHQK